MNKVKTKFVAVGINDEGDIQLFNHEDEFETEKEGIDEIKDYFDFIKEEYPEYKLLDIDGTRIEVFVPCELYGNEDFEWPYYNYRTIDHDIREEFKNYNDFILYLYDIYGNKKRYECPHDEIPFQRELEDYSTYPKFTIGDIVLYHNELRLIFSISEYNDVMWMKGYYTMPYYIEPCDSKLKDVYNSMDSDAIHESDLKKVGHIKEKYLCIFSFSGNNGREIHTMRSDSMDDIMNVLIINKISSYKEPYVDILYLENNIIHDIVYDGMYYKSGEIKKYIITYPNNIKKKEEIPNNELRREN